MPMILLASWLSTDKSKRCKLNPFAAADCGKNADLRWFGVERLCPLEFIFDPSPAAAAAPAPPPLLLAAAPMNSYRAPPLKLTLETIQEDKAPDQQLLYLVRSKSLPTQRRHHSLGNVVLSKIPDHQDDGTFFAGDDRGTSTTGVSMSGPILTTSDSEYAESRTSSNTSSTRRKDPFTKLRRAVSQLLSKVRQTARRSH